MVGRVVGGEEEFAQQGLAAAVGDGREQVAGGVAGDLGKGIAVAADGFDAGVPRLRGGRRGPGGPVVVGPAGLLVVRVQAEVEQVVLGEADVFEQFPERVRQPVGALAALGRRHVGHGFVERRVRLAPREHVGEGVAGGLGQRHGAGGWVWRQG